MPRQRSRRGGAGHPTQPPEPIESGKPRPVPAARRALGVVEDRPGSIPSRDETEQRGANAPGEHAGPQKKLEVHGESDSRDERRLAIAF
jgi:hypothetical protein